MGSAFAPGRGGEQCKSRTLVVVLARGHVFGFCEYAADRLAGGILVNPCKKYVGNSVRA